MENASAKKVTKSLMANVCLNAIEMNNVKMENVFVKIDLLNLKVNADLAHLILNLEMVNAFALEMAIGLVMINLFVKLKFLAALLDLNGIKKN